MRDNFQVSDSYVVPRKLLPLFLLLPFLFVIPAGNLLLLAVVFLACHSEARPRAHAEAGANPLLLLGVFTAQQPSTRTPATLTK
jgi:hypothetical protein